jgi:hypothetical protein
MKLGRRFAQGVMGVVMVASAVVVAAPHPAQAAGVLDRRTLLESALTRQAVFQATESALKLTDEAVLAELIKDKTLKEVIEANKGNVADVEKTADQLLQSKVSALETATLITSADSKVFNDKIDERVKNLIEKDRELATATLRNRLIEQALLAATEDATKLSESDMFTRLAKGNSYAKIIADANTKVKLADVEKSALTDFTNSVDSLVKAGYLTKVLAERVESGKAVELGLMLRENMVSHDYLRRDVMTQRALINATATATKLADKDIRAKLVEGKTFADIWKTAKVTASDVLTAAEKSMTDEVKTLLDTKVIDQIEADFLTAHLTTRLTYISNSPLYASALHLSK